jgi:hypothetical protein
MTLAILVSLGALFKSARARMSQGDRMKSKEWNIDPSESVSLNSLATGPDEEDIHHSANALVSTPENA